MDDNRQTDIDENITCDAGNDEKARKFCNTCHVHVHVPTVLLIQLAENNTHANRFLTKCMDSYEYISPAFETLSTLIQLSQNVIISRSYN